MGFWEWIWDTSMGPPGPNGHWPLWLSLTFHLANLSMGITYLMIPVLKYAYWPYRGKGIGATQYWKIMAYLPAMALSRIIRVGEVWGPPYHLTTLVDAIAAVIAAYSFFQLQSFFRHVISLPSVAEVEGLKLQVGQLRTLRRNEQAHRALRTKSIGKRLDALQDVHADDYATLVVLAEIRELQAGIPDPEVDDAG